MRRRTPGLVLVVLLALSPVEAEPQDEPPTFRSDAEVVVLDVVATDDDRRPVGDLSGEDLEVSEDGAACRILSFRLVRSEPAAPSESPPASPDRPAESPTTTATPTRASLVVLLFDRFTTQTAPLAREGALDLVSQSFPPDTWFAVFKVGYGTRLLAPFTTDTVRLHAAIEAATRGDADKLSAFPDPSLPVEAPAPPEDAPGGPEGPPIPDLGPIAGGMGAEEAALLQGVQGLDSLYAVLGIARALSSVQGRKAVVYLAEAWHLPARTRHVYDDAVSAANRANVTVHTVDVRGLTSTKPRPLTAADAVLATQSADYGGGTSGVGPPRAEAGGGLARDGMALRGVEDREQLLSGPRLERLAQDTGGLAIQHTNDLGHGLTGVAEELGHYYEVVYAPANPLADGKFRRIRVKTSRDGVRLRTRAGYYATPGRTAAVHPYELPLLDALGTSPELEDFTLRTGLLHFAPKGGERECLVLAEVPLSEVHLASDEAAGVYRAHLAFLGYVKDEAGRVIARLTHDWPIEGPLDEKESARRRSAIFRRGLSLPPGRYVLEAAAQDRETGARASTRASFEVPSATDSLALTSVVLPRRAAPATGVDSATDPLRIGDVSLIPGLGRPIETGTRPEVLVYVGVYPASPGSPVDLKVEFRRDGEVVAEASPDIPLGDSGSLVPWVGRMPVGTLGPGDFEVAIVARQGEARVEEVGRFEIVSNLEGAGAVAEARPPVDPELVPVLERAARYVVAYQDTFRNIVAEERYSQRVQGRARGGYALAAGARSVFRGEVTSANELQVQNTRADLVFARLAGDVPWGVFRDVFEVDGSRVRDRDERLERLFREPSPSAMEQAWRILDESARYNIGPRRTVNIPTMALLYLHPRNQSRFTFKKGGTRRFVGFEGLEVEFEEVQRPTLTRDSEGRSVPVRGRFWIHASRGTVLRSEARYQAGRAEGFITTQYRREPRLAMWVPDEMLERYRNLPSSQEPAPRDSAEAAARYSNYRQFRVSVDESATLPEP